MHMPVTKLLRFASPVTFLHRRSPKLRKPSHLAFSVVGLVATAMDSDTSCSLVLCGKSYAEAEKAVCLKNSNALKLKDNIETSVFLHSEMKNRFGDDSFDVSSFMNLLLTDQFGRFLIWSPLLPSTHDVVSQNFHELPVGAVCIADVQFKGRGTNFTVMGRRKNIWESPRGCLMYSFTLQMEDRQPVQLIQHVVCLAVTEAVKDVCDRNGLPFIDVKIKWPNDLYLNGLKVGGILCTSTSSSKKFHVSAGVGFNVDNKQPTTCLNAVLNEMSPVSKPLRREEILAAFFNKFEKFYDVFIAHQGFESLKELYYRAWLHSGQRVVVQDMIEDQVVENVVTVQGLTSSGYLLAIGDDYQMYELSPGAHSFDFFKGLVRKKL